MISNKSKSFSMVYKNSEMFISVANVF